LARDDGFRDRLALSTAERILRGLLPAGGSLSARALGAAVEGLRGAAEPPIEIGRRGGVLTLPIPREPDSFNYVSARTLVSFAIGMQIFEPLIWRNLWTLGPEPRLASSWEVSPDGHVWTVHLRRDARWSDGEAFDADDVLFTVEAISHPAVFSYSKKDFEYAMPDGSVQPLRVEKVDAHTVRFVQPLPYAAFWEKLRHPILPEHALRAALERGEFSSTWGPATPPEQIVGTGPFVPARVRPGEEVVLRRNPHHWRRDARGTALPYLDEVRFRVVEDEGAARLRFLARELDLLPREYLEGEHYAEIAAEAEGRGFRLVDEGQDVAYLYLVLNQNTGSAGKPAPVAEPLGTWMRTKEFRQAIAHAIDREALVRDCLDGLGHVVWSVMNRACGKYHTPELRRYEHDRAKARALLDGLGLVDRDGDGVREDAQGHRAQLTITWYRRSSSYECFLERLRQQLAEVGLRVYENRVGDRSYDEKLFSTFEWEALFGRETGGFFEPMGSHPMWSSSGGFHIWFPLQAQPATPWEARIDALLAQASLERDEGRRLACMHEMQRIVAEEAPILPLVVEHAWSALRNDVHNFRPGVIEPNSVWNLYEIFRAAE
ncbi:MAG: ABC transporter substrate-binding protein, partial [Planctomycetes bacterium]|nr:ABC transporter substrate-binding protein [Planctomycetota bacterium]